MFIRQQWISACSFHELVESQVLEEVVRRAGAVERPLVLLDLDSTLYEVGPRTYRILLEWLDSPQSHEFQDVREALSKLQQSQVGYSVRDTLKAVGYESSGPRYEEVLEAIKNFWADRFFTSQYLAYDRPYPGAADFARRLYELGVEIVYLTGRDEPNMGDGTRANLLRDGFPWELPRTHLLLKPDAKQPDLDHKLDAAHYIRKHGTLVASFENEPPNVVALAKLFPEAMHVFVDTVCSDHPAGAHQGLFKISRFA